MIVFLTMVGFPTFRRQKAIFAMQTLIQRTMEYIVIVLFLGVVCHEQVTLAVCWLQHRRRRRRRRRHHNLSRRVQALMLFKRNQ